MKVVLFCGGRGLRLQEASSRVPKPLIPVGQQPILLHLMKYYAYHRHTDFILCLGHNAHAFKEYFLNYNEALQNDFVLAQGGREIELLKRDIEDWRITFVDTGRKSTVGERLRLVREHLEGEEYFLANYGDQLSDAPLDSRVERLKSEDKVASVLCVKPAFTAHVIKTADHGLVTDIGAMDDGSLWINGGYLIFRHDIFDYLEEGEELVEEPFRRLIAAEKLIADRHEGFWAPMDTLKEKERLDALADTVVPPWAVWLQDSKVAVETHTKRPVTSV
jgi:glucose-1-phosphate cytidylyltransferase